MSDRSVPLFWRKSKQMYNLIGSACITCGTRYFPGRRICPQCRKEGRMHEFKFSGKGQVVTYSVVRDAPEGYELEVPYIVAIVQLEEGPKLTTPITYCDLDEIFIGMPVEVCFRKLREAGDHGIIIYGYKFRPIKGAKPK